MEMGPRCLAFRALARHGRGGRWAGGVTRRRADPPEGAADRLYPERAIGDPRIAVVAFTGSVEGGHAVQRAAAQRFIATGLELGGKDPAYVRADADLSSTVENLVDGSYFNSGQSCCGIERVYVDKKLFRPFVDGFVELTKKYRLGNPLDAQTTLGPVVRTKPA